MKRLMRNALLVAVTAFAAASPLNATPPTGDGHFQLLTKAAPNDWFNRTGEFTASYNAITLPTLTAFYVFCVDRTGSIVPGNNYDAWVSEVSLAGLSGGKSELGAGTTAFETYRRQAYLVQTYYLQGGNTGLTGSENEWQFAVWGLKELGLGATQSAYEGLFGVYQGGLAWNVIVATGALGAPGGAFDATDWRVITDAANDCNDRTAKCQELIFKSGSPPQDIIPEPATMSLLAMGLAGMAGAGIRRRKK